MTAVPSLNPQPDVVLIGAGVMSATLAVLLQKLQPDLRIALLEERGGAAQESSNAWNNAGTGHAALCELNYTPQRADGSVDISRALKVNTQFDLSRQLWASLVRGGAIPDADAFIHAVPHISFVRGASDVAFLRKRWEAMSAHHCFAGMEYAEDHAELARWMPLVMEGRDPNETVAATRMVSGTDVDFGALTRLMIAHLATTPNFTVGYGQEVTDLKRENGRWTVEAKDCASGRKQRLSTQFVFLGAGGGALPLLQKSGIPEGRGFGGFPVSGLWLRCDVPALADRHDAKVYGKASVGTPPMSVPHLDARVIDGNRALLFGPYAGFSTKFLKHGSNADLFLAIKPDNIGPLLAVGRDNMDLTKYLIGQVMLKPSQRFASLQEYFPNAKQDEWELAVAGQRVQVIMPDAKAGGVLQFGTEVVASGDGSLAAVLGASPGASTAVAIMLDVLARCFKDQLPSWIPRLQELIPSYGRSIADDADLCRQVRTDTASVLHLAEPAVSAAG
ncbi:MAG: malate dehydrogenase (quinone) [Candidatus Eremiobacteraeota bacterium]|nr:malate dehydrogenase (quinone) [Candidatus Eremiobacteraeota bacterium]